MAAPDRLFVVIRAHGADWQRDRTLQEQAEWDAHAVFMNALADDGFVVLAGSLGDDDAMLVVRAESEDAVRTGLADDPWTKSGLLRTTLVAPWTLRVGSLEPPAPG
jgi:hypothetical protein